MTEHSITLYYTPFTRALRPMWILEELGLVYELKKLDIKLGQHKSSDYIKIHPLGLVPALKIDDKVLIESAAMCMWLADQYPQKRLCPEIASFERAEYYQWFFLACNHLEPELVKIFMHTKRLPESERIPKEVEKATEAFTTCAAIFENALKDKKYLVKNHFSAADIFVGSQMIWAESMGLLNEFNSLTKYCANLKGRKEYQSAQQKAK